MQPKSAHKNWSKISSFCCQTNDKGSMRPVWSIGGKEIHCQAIKLPFFAIKLPFLCPIRWERTHAPLFMITPDACTSRLPCCLVFGLCQVLQVICDTHAKNRILLWYYWWLCRCHRRWQCENYLPDTSTHIKVSWLMISIIMSHFRFQVKTTRWHNFHMASI